MSPRRCAAPDMTALSSTLAKVLGRLGRTDEAANVENRALRMDSPAPPCRAAMEHVAGQRAAPADGSTRSPSPPISSPANALHSQSFAHLSAGAARSSRGLSARRVRLDPDLAASWSPIAEIQADRGDFEQSNNSARTALAICPELAERTTDWQQILRAISLMTMSRQSNRALDPITLE